ncbi:hypothetical protein Droror1_Dr00015246, partial [Drosera rotundifolia]
MNDEAWDIFNSLDMKYVLIVFGGLAGYSSDDMNEFRWMVECVTSWCRLQTASRWCGLFDSDPGGVVPCGFVGALPVERWCLYRRDLVTFGSRSIFRLEDGCSRFVAGGVVLVILWRPR